MSAPVQCLHLFSDFVQGEVRLVVRPELPVGVQVILGNRLAWACMWPAVPPPCDYAGSPVDQQVPVSNTESHVTSIAPEVVSTCVVTRAATSTDGKSDVVNIKE